MTNVLEARKALTNLQLEVPNAANGRFFYDQPLVLSEMYGFSVAFHEEYQEYIIADNVSVLQLGIDRHLSNVNLDNDEGSRALHMVSIGFGHSPGTEEFVWQLTAMDKKVLVHGDKGFIYRFIVTPNNVEGILFSVGLAGSIREQKANEDEMYQAFNMIGELLDSELYGNKINYLEYQKVEAERKFQEFIADDSLRGTIREDVEERLTKRVRGVGFTALNLWPIIDR